MDFAIDFNDKTRLCTEKVCCPAQDFDFTFKQIAVYLTIHHYVPQSLFCWCWIGAAKAGSCFLFLYGHRSLEIGPL